MKKIIIANWKMNPKTSNEARKIFKSDVRNARKVKNAEVVIAPPFVYLQDFLKNRGKIKLGAQDVFFKEEGPYTGEISASMLKSLGASYVIIGHSERREHLGESDELISKKLKAAVSKNLKAVLCVGERERNKEGFPQIVKMELKSALHGIPKSKASRVIIAYEPIWAIGKGKSDTPHDLFEMSIFIRRVILDIWGKNSALRTQVLYGGSVTSKNARSFLETKGINGLLVGGASLKAGEFGKILAEV